MDIEDASSLQLSQETMALQLAVKTPQSQPQSQSQPPRRPSLASELPQEVLVIVMSFGQVGRVCKSWSLAMSTRACLSCPSQLLTANRLVDSHTCASRQCNNAVARRKFSTRLGAILLPYTSTAAAVALEVESELFDVHGQSFALPKSYGQKARQLLFNLKDTRNAALRERLLSGELPARALVRMSAADMANPQLVRQRKEWIKKRTHEVMRSARELDGFMESDLFECRSCGSGRTRYRQYRRKAIVDRTRIIVLCLSCPYSWEL